MRRALPLAALAVLCASGALTLAGGAAAAPTASQKLFRKTLLDDPRTSASIKALLQSGGGFVAPDIDFADVSGDGRSDALVLVETGGAAGAVALYVLSTHGQDEDSALRAVYRSQRLHRATADNEQGGLVLRTPRFSEGDDLCCPAKVVERRYTWSDRRRSLVQRSSREIDGPGGDGDGPRSRPGATNPAAGGVA